MQHFEFNTTQLILSLSFSLIGLPALHAAEASRPNILFAIADDWGLHAGAYGTPWVKTPSFDRIAREGLLFRNAYTPMAKCAPSRAIVLTGRHLWQNEEAGNHMAMFPPKLKSWPEVLLEKGWHMGITGKGWGPGIANDASGKPRLITGKRFDKHKAEPHRAYEFQAGVNKGGKMLADIDRVPDYWPDNETVRHDMLDYAFEVEHMHNHLGRMIAELEKRGQLDNTLAIVTSDHGMPFPRVKGYAYHDSIHVPLAVRWPNGVKSPGRAIEDFVDFTDIAATILDYAGIARDDSGMMPVTGKSWRPILESTQAGRIVPERDHVLIGKERTDVGRPHNWGYPIRGIVTAEHLYLHNYEPTRWPAGNPETGYLDTDGGPDRHPAELYNIEFDPEERHNLAANPKYAGVVKDMQGELLRVLKEVGLTPENDKMPLDEGIKSELPDQKIR